MLRKQGKAPALVDDDAVERATQTPPQDSRAAGRGHVVRAMAEAHADDTIRWDILARRLGERAVWGDERFVVYEYVDDWRDIRDTGAWHPHCPHVRIDNSGALAEAGIALIAAIDSLAMPPDT